MEERNKLGMKAGAVGIIVNLALFIMKIIIGISSKSSAIVADAINNLSDFLSSTITVLGFRLSNLPADREHPFGHARFELISGFIISIIMLYLGIDTLRQSVVGFFNPKTVTITKSLFIILFLSIIFKIFLYFYYKKKYLETQSEVMIANAQDSVNDVLITTSILIGFFINLKFKINLDSVLGLIIAGVIIYSSIEMIRSFVHDLLGARPDESLIDGISAILESDNNIIGFHDLIIHNYGLDQYYATVHVEVDADLSLLAAHDIVDHLEYQIQKKYEMDMVIHLDPLDTNDPKLRMIKKDTKRLLKQIHPELEYHDLRLFHHKLIFDVVVPESVGMNDDELKSKIKAIFRENGYGYKLSITFDRNYLLE